MNIQVLDSVSGAPVAGASVSAIGVAGVVIARALSSLDGSATLRLANTPTRIRVLKIGFHPRVLDLDTAGSANVARLVISITRLPARLTSVVTTASRSDCPSDPSARLGLTLWDQARAGFDAVLAQRDANPARVRLLRFDRTMARHGDQIETQSVARIDTTSAATFFAARSATDFQRLGYVDDDPSGRVYYAPDADALMDPTFTQAHCFAAVSADDSHHGMRGVSFRPVTAVDGRADITGTMWLDSATLIPRELEFKYTDLEPAVSSAGAGGAISFRQAAAGVLFIDRWSLRVIAPGETTHDESGRMTSADVVPRRRRFDATVVSIHDVGGEVARATWPDGSSWRDTLASMRGRVVRVGSGTPTGGRVWAQGTDYSAPVDSAGYFAIDELLPGPYRVAAADSSFGPFGVAQQEPRTVTAIRDSTSTVNLSLWDSDETFDRLCGKQRHPPGTVAVLGIVLHGTRAGAPVHVRAAWPGNGEAGTTTGHGGVSSGTTDSDGRFTMCGIPVETRVSFKYTIDGQSPAGTVFEFASGRPVAAVILSAHGQGNRPDPR